MNITLDDGRTELWQWDTGRKIVVDDKSVSEVHYSKYSSTQAITREVINGKAEIPNFLLQDTHAVTVYAYSGSIENGYTMAEKTFNVEKKPKPANYVETEEDKAILAKLKAAIGDLSEFQTEAKGNLVDAINEVSASSVQPDWNQNDNTRPDYVKNRPFYSGTRNVTVENVTDAALEGFPVFAVGDTVTVNVDGVEHSLVAFNDDDYPTIGDTTSSIDNGEGQLGWQIFVGETEVCFYAEEAHTVSYLGIDNHKLDKKYMPDEVLEGIDYAQTAANSAQIAANSAQTAANRAQTAADNAQTAANNAQTAANGKANVISRSITIYDKLDVLDIQVGKTFTATKEGYMVDGPFKKGDIVIIKLGISEPNIGRREFHYITTIANGGYDVSGIYPRYDMNNHTVANVYAVHLKNVQGTSTLSLIRLA